MAEYIIKLDQAKMAVGYVPVPTLDPSALGVIVAKQTQDYNDAPGLTTTTRYTSNPATNPGGPFITGAQLSAAPAWLIFFSGNMGTDGNNTEPRAYLLDSHTTVDRTWAFGGAKGSYASADAPTLDKPARNAQCSGAFVYIPNGTNLEFAFENRSGNGTCYFHDFEIIAVPTTLSLPPSDVIYSYIAPDHSDATGVKSFSPPGSGFVNMQLTNLISEADNYLVLMTGAANNSNSSGGNIECRFVQDGAAIGSDWKKSVKDGRDLISFNLMKIIGLPSGQFSVFEMHGLAGGGRIFYHPRTLIMRLGAYARYKYTGTPSTPVPITKVYPNWQTVCGATFTPIAETGEYALMLGRVEAYRTDFGAVLARLIIQYDDGSVEVLKDYTCTDNITNLDYSRPDIFMAGAKLVNTPLTYKLQVCQADGTTGTAFVGESTLAVIGMSPNIGPPNIVPVSVSDQAANSTSSIGTVGGTGTLINSVGLTDSSSPAISNPQVTLISSQPSTPALVRPRLWLRGDRLPYMRSRVGAAQWTQWMNVIISAPFTQTWQYVLKWKVTQDGGDLAVARDSYFGATGLFSKNIVSLLWGDGADNHTDSGFNYRFIMRDLAIALDWFYDDSGADVMTVANGFPANARAQLRNAMLAMTYAKTQTRTAAVAMDAVLDDQGSYLDWANTDTHNNHFYDMMMGATYAALTLYGESPATFQYKPSTTDSFGNTTATFPASQWMAGQTFNFSIPYHIYSGNPANYTDIWSWVQARVTTMMLPTLDVDMVGGFTEEGTNYGLSSAIYMTEMFSLLKSAAGQSHLDAHSCFKDHGYFQIYQTQPGITNNVNLGDQPNAPAGRALVVDRNRLCALMIADAFPSTEIAGFLQYWLNHKLTAMGGTEKVYEPWDFLLYRDTAPETDIANMPPNYVASGTGFWNSRDLMSDIGVSVSMSACSHGEEHHHSDFGALQIYRGDSPAPGDPGFLVIDLNMKSPIGNNWDLVAHCSDTFATAAFPGGWAQQYYGIPPVVPPPPPNVPPVPVLSSPANAATGVAVPVSCSWALSSGATSYTFQLATDIGFSNLISYVPGIAAPPISVSGLNSGSVYYWRVLATNANGSSVYSAPFSFTTAGVITPPPPGGIKLVEDTSLLQVFPTTNWWNLDISAAPLHASSASLITGMYNYGLGTGDRVGGFHPDWGDVSSTYGIPYIGVDGTQPLVQVGGIVSIANGGQSDIGQPGRPTGFPIPTQAHLAGAGTTPGWREENGDNHLIVFDRQNMLLSELYQAVWNGSSWSATQASCFQMNTNNRRPEGITSASGGGLAIFPGLVKYDDMFSGNPIHHATRFALGHYTAAWVFPASHSGVLVDDPAPAWPAGLRLRLKASFNIATFVSGFSSLPAASKAGLTVLLQSWKTYGLIFDDRGSHGFIQGTMDNRWVNGEFNQSFKALKFTDFEVIQYGWNG